jgi:hypothetical protein
MATTDFSLGAILASQLDSRLDGGPWWAGFLLVGLALVPMCLRIVFPQDSKDKLAWWRDRRRTRRTGTPTNHNRNLLCVLSARIRGQSTHSKLTPGSSGVVP